MNMKEIKNILLLSFVLLLFSSCEELFNTRSGQEIRFSVSSGNDIMTRTSYSGETAGDKERIDWVTGDEVAVYLYLNNAPGYTFSNTFSDYIVTLTEPVTNSETYISKGTLASKYVDDDGNSLTTLKWVGDDVNQVGHRFYSVYPADYSGSLNEVEVDGGKKIKVDFTGLANQATVTNDQIMNYAYMAAAAPKVYFAKDNEKVDLNYYPMVTTIYVKLVNESTETLSPTVKIKAKEGTTPLAGPFSVWLNGDGDFTPEIVLPDSESDSNLGFVQELERTVSVAGKTEDPGTAEAIFFLLPTDYSGENITLSLSGGKNTSEWNLKTDVDLDPSAFHKYNLTIKIDKNGRVERPTIDDIGDGGAQILASLLVSISQRWNSSPTLRDYLSSCFPDKDWSDNNSFGNPFNIWMGGKLNNVTKESLFKELKELLGEDWKKLLQAIVDTETDINLPDLGGGLTANVDSTDFQIFRNITSIKMQVKGSVSVASLPNLTTAEFEYVTSVEISNCSSLTSVTIKNGNDLSHIFIQNCESFDVLDVPVAGKLSEIKLIKTPYFTKGTIQNANQPVNVTLIDCSTAVTSATLSLNGRGNVITRTNSSNVTVN